MTLAVPPRDPDASVRRLLVLSVPAVLIGILSALVLWVLDRLAEALEGVVWDTVPDALGLLVSAAPEFRIEPAPRPTAAEPGLPAASAR